MVSWLRPARYPPLFVRTPSWSVSRSERQTSERITTAVVFSMADYQEPVRLWCWVAESRVTCVSHLGPWLLGVWHAWFRYMCVPGLAVAVLHPGRSCYNVPSLARCLLPPNFVSPAPSSSNISVSPSHLSHMRRRRLDGPGRPLAPDSATAPRHQVHGADTARSQPSLTATKLTPRSEMCRNDPSHCGSAGPPASGPAPPISRQSPTSALHSPSSPVPTAHPADEPRRASMSLDVKQRVRHGRPRLFTCLYQYPGRHGGAGSCSAACVSPLLSLARSLLR